MRILITGASGFVGEALCKRLLSEGYKIVGVVRNNVGTIADIEYVKKQIDGNTDWSDVLDKTDVVVHLASRTHILNDDFTDSFEAFKSINVEGTRNLATQSIKQGIKRFIYLSSIKANGEATNDLPYSELTSPAPEDSYGRTKYLAELELKKIAADTSMEFVIIRPPLVYGEGVKANFNSLIKLSNLSIPIPLGSITNKRSLIYLGNLVDSINICINNKAAANQVFLVSDGEDISIGELIRRISKAFDKRVFLFRFPIKLLYFLASLVGKQAILDKLSKSLIVDSSKIRKELNWSPPYTMDQGLKATANWYSSQIHKR